MPDKKDEVTFPENQEYLDRINAAKSVKVPLGGAPMPKIPPLDQPIGDRRYEGVQPVQGQTSSRGILSPQQMAEMQRQGKLIPGVGSAYAFNQPAAGEVQAQAAQQAAGAPTEVTAPPGAQYANPPRPAGAGLRPETVEQLTAVAQATAGGGKDKKLEKSEQEKEADAATALLDAEDDFDVDELGNKVRNMLVNKERREAIEKRCPPMNLEDLLIHQEIRQTVPIIPETLTVTYRSMSGAEDLFVKQRMFGMKGSSQYILDSMAVMNLCMSLVDINRRPLPNHLDKDGDPDPDLFNTKFKFLLKFPIQMIADLSVNFSWFDRRVKKLFVIDEVKGF